MAKKPGLASRLISADRMKRALGRPAAGGALSPTAKTAIFFGVLAVLTALVAWLDPRPSLRHVKVAMLSAGVTGNYYATVEKIGAEVARRKGRVQNLPSNGSVENVQRLIASAKDCTLHFGLVQQGIPLPEGHKLELIGRLTRPESLTLLGRNVARVRTPADLKGLRIGIGPDGSGTQDLMRNVLALFEGVDVVPLTLPIDQQLAMAERGQLDLAAMVLDDEGKLLDDAVTQRHMEILQLPAIESLARHLPYTRVGVIQAGQMDYARKLPREDKKVLQVDALIVGNGCAPDGVQQQFLMAVADVYPTFIRHNKGQANLTGLPMSPVAANFYSAEGPDLLGKYAPWAVDIMPMPTWIQLGVAFSILFSGMALWHRFRLWRVDANRVKIERDVEALFGADVSVDSIAELPVDERYLEPDNRAQLEGLVRRLSALLELCRKQSMSVLVPMGEEMQYRFQEALMADLLRALRQYMERLPRA
jgi:TRAP-type uncharacterized transport system substrate-binding protein